MAEKRHERPEKKKDSKVRKKIREIAKKTLDVGGFGILSGFTEDQIKKLMNTIKGKKKEKLPLAKAKGAVQALSKKGTKQKEKYKTADAEKRRDIKSKLRGGVERAAKSVTDYVKEGK